MGERPREIPIVDFVNVLHVLVKIRLLDEFAGTLFVGVAADSIWTRIRPLSAVFQPVVPSVITLSTISAVCASPPPSPYHSLPLRTSDGEPNCIHSSREYQPLYNPPSRSKTRIALLSL